jgi:hypothetical protein
MMGNTDPDKWCGYKSLLVGSTRMKKLILSFIANLWVHSIHF